MEHTDSRDGVRGHIRGDTVGSSTPIWHAAMIIAGRGEVTGVFDKTGGKPGPVARALVLRASTREAYIEQTKARGTYDMEMANPLIEIQVVCASCASRSTM